MTNKDNTQSAGHIFCKKYNLANYIRTETLKLVEKSNKDLNLHSKYEMIKMTEQVENSLNGYVVYTLTDVNFWTHIPKHQKVSVGEHEPIILWNLSEGELVLPNNTKFMISSRYLKDHPMVFLQEKFNPPYKSYSEIVNQLYLIPFGEEVKPIFENKKICVTGATDRDGSIRRETIKFIVTALGGTFQTAVSNSTNYLITLDDYKNKAPSTKMKKAANIPGIKIMTITEFVSMLPDLPSLS